MYTEYLGLQADEELSTVLCVIDDLSYGRPKRTPEQVDDSLRYARTILEEKAM